jgi:hypothetical protein
VTAGLDRICARQLRKSWSGRRKPAARSNKGMDKGVCASRLPGKLHANFL